MIAFILAIMAALFMTPVDNRGVVCGGGDVDRIYRISHPAHLVIKTFCSYQYPFVGIHKKANIFAIFRHPKKCFHLPLPQTSCPVSVPNYSVKQLVVSLDLIYNQAMHSAKESVQSSSSLAALPTRRLPFTALSTMFWRGMGCRGSIVHVHVVSAYPTGPPLKSRLTSSLPQSCMPPKMS